MSALSAAEFFKEPSNSRPDRKLVFLKKYKEMSAFIMADGTNVVFNFDPIIYDKVASMTGEDKKAYNEIVLKDITNKTYKINSIAKSKEFGGGGGSGAGAENTKKRSAPYYFFVCRCSNTALSQ